MGDDSEEVLQGGPDLRTPNTEQKGFWNGVENKGIKSKFTIDWGEPSSFSLLNSQKNADCLAYNHHSEVRKIFQNGEQKR